MVFKPNLDGDPEVMEAVKMRRLQQERFGRWNENINFWVGKGSGLGGALVGVADLIHPTLVPSMHHPEYLVGGGLAVLAGKSIIKVIEALITVFK